jgi:hypothetical protein
MTLDRLKFARFIVPPILIILYAALLGFFITRSPTSLPDFAKSLYLPILIIPGALYYISPLRKWINAPHHNRITERVRTGLVEMTGYPDRETKYSWRKLCPLFYDLIDQDESLKQKAKLAYFNGLIWTSFADATALAILFAIISGFVFWLGIEDALIAGAIFVLIAVISFFGSLITTSKQINIGAEQLEVIEYKYKSNVERRLNDLDK